MAQLIVRDLDARLVRKLRVRAAKHGHSAEEEHRSILRAALDKDDVSLDVIFEMPPGDYGDAFERRQDTNRGRKVDL